jgi:ferric-dicitrate binding protein FerR (iron transport regulator)
MNHQMPLNDELITKYLCGEASADEAIMLETWKAASPENQKHFDQMQKTHHMVYGKDASLPDKERARKSLKKSLFGNTISFRKYYIAAAFILGMAVLSVFMWNEYMSNQDVKILAKDDSVHQVLNDDSEVTLAQNGQITIEKGFGKTHRHLHLSGKAEFNVKHLKTKPFIIDADGVYIEDIGTVFTVKSLPFSDTVFAIVKEGIVKLYDDAGSQITIKAGEEAWYVRSQKKIITDPNTKTIKFDFRDTSLSDIIALLQETYHVDITLTPKSIGSCQITTQFFDEDLATIITIITETLGFKYQYEDHHFKIEGKPCQ